MIEPLKSLKDKHREQRIIEKREEESEERKTQRGKRVKEGRKIKKVITN